MKFLNKLPFKNISAKPGRSLSLLIFAVLLAITSFGGSLIVKSLKNGLGSLEKRLGADIIVVPYQTRTKESIESLLLNGNRTNFYMSKNYIEEVLKYDGIEIISPQLFLSSISAGCCSVKVQIIGFEPETDFTIQPWAHESYKGNLKDFEILVGSKITLPANMSLTFYNTKLKIAAQLKETGSGLDNAVYCNMNTIRELINQAAKISNSPTGKIDSSSSISTILIKVGNDYEVNQVLNEINLHTRKVRAIKAKSMTSDIADNLAKISKIVSALIAIVWVLCIVIMMIVFSMIINERKKEFAVLRVIGVSQKKLSKLVIQESLFINLFGGLLGILFVLLINIPFKSSIQRALGMPFLLPSFWEIFILLILTLAISILAGTISSLITAKKISSLDAGIILRTEN